MCAILKMPRASLKSHVGPAEDPLTLMQVHDGKLLKKGSGDSTPPKTVQFVGEVQAPLKRPNTCPLHRTNLPCAQHEFCTILSSGGSEHCASTAVAPIKVVVNAENCRGQFRRREADRLASWSL